MKLRFDSYSTSRRTICPGNSQSTFFDDSLRKSHQVSGRLLLVGFAYLGIRPSHSK